MIISCCSCNAVSPENVAGLSNMAEIAKKTGYSYVFDQRNGLSPLYLCPPCTQKTMGAIAILKDVFGDKLTMVSLLPLMRRK